MDAQLITWRLAEDGTRASGWAAADRSADQSWPPPGCQLAVAPDGALLVSTGHARPTTARTCVAGRKVLRLDLTRPALPDKRSGTTGSAAAVGAHLRHRNVKGLATPGQADVAAEHGRAARTAQPAATGRNYGWDPSRGGRNPVFYDESVPMTDLRRFPDDAPLWTSERTPRRVRGLSSAEAVGEPGCWRSPRQGQQTAAVPARSGVGARGGVPPALDGTHGRQGAAGAGRRPA